MNNTLNNGFMILERMAGTAELFSIKELADYFRLPNSHVCRLLKTLTETGYVEQDRKSRKYRVSCKILELSNACLKRMQIRTRVRPFASKLCRENSIPVYLTVPHEGHALIVDVFYTDNANSDAGIAIGGINDAHVTACGKVCAAYRNSPEELEKLDLYKVTDKTITDRNAFADELEKVKAQGFAVTDSEKGRNVNAVAAPVFNCDGEFVAAIGTQPPSRELSSAEWDSYVGKIVECAESCSFALGFAAGKLV